MISTFGCQTKRLIAMMGLVASSSLLTGKEGLVSGGGVPNPPVISHSQLLSVDVRKVLEEVLGVRPALDDLNHDGLVNVLDAAVLLTPQTSVVLSGQTYHLRPHPRGWLDGPSGALTAAMGNKSTGRPQSSNPAYAGIQSYWTLDYFNAAHLPGFNCDPTPGFLCLSSMYPVDGGNAGTVPLIQATWAAYQWMAAGSDPNDTTYLPTVIYAIDHVEDVLGGMLGCREDLDYCGERFYGIDYGRLWLSTIGQLYSVARSIPSGPYKLTPTQIQLFADKMLNGNSVGNNGFGGSSTALETDCVNQGMTVGTGTVSVSGTSITASSPIFDSSWVEAALVNCDNAIPGCTAGIGLGGANYTIGRIASVQDSTHATLSRNEPSITNRQFIYSKKWQPSIGGGVGNCGFLWWLFHHVDTIPITATNMALEPAPSASWTASYPPSGGNYPDTYGSPWSVGSRQRIAGINNKVLTQTEGLIGIALALADDDIRARNLLSLAYNWHYKNSLPVTKSYTTPFTMSGSQYATWRNHPLQDSITMMVCNSLTDGTTPCNDNKGNSVSSQIPYYLYMPKLGDATWRAIDDWGGGIGAYQFPNAVCAAGALYPSDPLLPYATFVARNFMQGRANSNYIWCDPNVTAADPSSGAPKQHLFRQTDYAQCAANADWTSDGQCIPNAAMSYVSSLTGFTANDTRVLLNADTTEPNIDHAGALAWGDFHIFKGANSSGDNQYLLGYENYTDGYCAHPAKNYNVPQFGSGNNNYWPLSDGIGNTRVTRWAGVDPSGPADNAYTYAMVDMNPSSFVAPTRSIYAASAGAGTVLRELLHSKPAGQQDYVVTKMYMNTTSAQTLRELWHYTLSAINQFTDFSFSGSNKTAQVIHGAAGTKLLSKFVPVGVSNSLALVTENGNGSWTPSNGYTALASTCASLDGATCNANATSYEAITVHMPVLSTTAVLPTIISLPVTASGGNADAIQIADSGKPRVILFARAGALLSSASWTTSHSGTAQYLLTDLAAGTYTVMIGGAPVAGSPFTVASGDGCLEFDSTAGPVSVTMIPGSAPAAAVTARANQGVAKSTNTAEVVAHMPLGPPSRLNPTLSLAESVNTATGNYYSSHVDLQVKGRRLPFSFTRYYNSNDTYTGPLGTGWTHSYNLFLSADPRTGLVTIKQADGSQIDFAASGQSGYTPVTAGLFDQLVSNADRTVTLIRKDQTQLLFSSAGKLIKILEPNGNTQILTYDGCGYLTTVTDDSGRQFIFDNDAEGRITSITDPAGREIRYSYDAAGNLTAFEDATGGLTQYAYDAGHRLISGTDVRGVVYVQNAYDGQGRVIAQKDSRGLATTLAYNYPSRGITTITDPRGNSIQHVYYDGLRIDHVIDARNGITSFAYDANNNRTAVTDARGKTVHFAYDMAGNTTSVVDPVGNMASFDYDAYNRLLTAKNPAGKATTFAYDGAHNLISATDAGGSRTTLEYDRIGQLISRTDTAGRKTLSTYDADGNVVSVTGPTGRSTAFAYDRISRLVSVKDGNGLLLSMAHDNLNRGTKTTDPLGNRAEDDSNAAGNLLKTIDANGNITAYRYENASNLIEVTDALGNISTYGYDENHDRIVFQNAKGATSTYTYDSLHQPTRIGDRLGNSGSFVYDPLGNVVSVTDENGQTHTFSYDPSN